MMTRMVSFVAGATFAITMLGCSSARVETPALQPPQFVLERSPWLTQQGFKACTLGKSCLALDERPFEPCLVAGKRCADKITEPILVDRPNGVAPPPGPSIGASHATVSPE